MDLVKQALGQAALNFIKPNMLVGLGTGTTAAHFIQAIAKRCEKGLKIKAVASSNESNLLAKNLKIPLVDISEIDTLDIYVDGADEVDINKQMIKGRGGALLKEKILAKSSKKTIIMIEKKKYVEKLGKCQLPVEITKFAKNLTKNRLDTLGYSSKYRMDKNSDIFVTDDQNYILDVKLTNLIQDPVGLSKKIKLIPGVVESGLFIDLLNTLIIANSDAKIEIIS
ncbi:MAG: Ribose-5-phosphate isomerase A [Candidatus Anoxychlamydiales bacterium]|nr:Ribose-5-phosphate isomerase A [Candidatus Anoxychlamydiales bacterium]NGX35778.1 Ribose-5-phosphate isomerase A [Candidatus Anoxychlamydiales bacterium]